MPCVRAPGPSSQHDNAVISSRTNAERSGFAVSNGLPWNIKCQPYMAALSNPPRNIKTWNAGETEAAPALAGGGALQRWDFEAAFATRTTDPPELPPPSPA